MTFIRVQGRLFSKRFVYETDELLLVVNEPYNSNPVRVGDSYKPNDYYPNVLNSIGLIDVIPLSLENYRRMIVK